MAGLKAGMIQRIYKTQAKDIVHSNVYAKAQRAYGGVPQHQSMSFAERTKIDNNRTYVKGYEHSHMTNLNSGNRMPMASSTGGTQDATGAQQGQNQAHVMQRGYGRTSSQDLMAEWGYGRTSGSREELHKGYGRVSGDRESIHPGYGRTSGDRESLQKGYGRMTTADAAQAKAGTGFANAAAQRQAQAERFAGTRRLSSTPSAAPRPAIKPNFGPHH